MERREHGSWEGSGFRAKPNPLLSSGRDAPSVAHLLQYSYTHQITFDHGDIAIYLSCLHRYGAYYGFLVVHENFRGIRIFVLRRHGLRCLCL